MDITKLRCTIGIRKQAALIEAKGANGSALQMCIRKGKRESQGTAADLIYEQGNHLANSYHWEDAKFVWRIASLKQRCSSRSVASLDVLQIANTR